MKKITQFLLMSLLMLSTAAMAQTTLKGKVTADGFPLPGANVIEQGTTNGASTDIDGNFTLQSNASSGTIVISYVGYTSITLTFDGSQDFGTVSLVADNSLEEVIVVGTGVIDIAEARKTPVAVSTIRGKDIQLKISGNSEFTESMKNTPSVYVSNQAGGFGDSRIFLRGFDDTNTAFLLNGQPINSVEDGRMFWSNWAGMADVANAVQVQRGLGSSKLAISSVGGTVNIVSKTTEQRKGGFFRVMGGNDSFMKATVAYNSGVNDKGWAFSVLVDHWQAHRKYSIGTAGQGQNYLFSVGYKPNEQHTFNFLLTGAPQWHDQNFSSDLEEYDMFTEKYNPNTGFRDGERFTERRNYYHKPVANLNWDFNINETMDLSTVLYASWGRGGGTGMLGRGSRIRNDIGEIDFDQIVQNNIDAADSDGFAGFSDGRVRRASINNHNWYGLLSNLNFTSGENWSFNVGFDGRLYRGDHWRQINDLMGLSGYIDNFRTDRPDDYVFTNTFEANPWAALFDFADEADRTQYDYSENINYIGGFGQAEYSTDKFSVFVQGAVSTQSFQREGRFVGTGNGLGKSAKINKTGYQIKGGASYNLDENHSVFANAGTFSRQPFLDNIFADIRNSNDLVQPEIDNEEIVGLEAGYRFKNDVFRFNLDVYRTEWGNRFLTFGTDLPGPDGIVGNDDDEFGNYRFTDVTQVHSGVEFDFEYRPIGGKVSLRGYGSLGNWKYEGTTPFTLQNDDTGEFVETDGTAELSGVKVGNAPQTSFGAGIVWNVCQGLSVDMDYNIFSDLYEFVDVEDAVQAALDGETFQAERLPAYTLADAGLTYRFSLGDNPLVFRANVNNVFNTAYINQRDRFGYFLGIGRTFNASLRYNF
ncbi:TonB-dependent receptor [Psychroserpens sp.]|uniref:TonB-dependent receptor n=1 Tax=Psychroserpens sp. TaxID=2020870 RepID=UPI001B15E5F4|nr:TonB-dependent receptor [Psychroserpens sp.]MBO6605582.1 TonB-dependent receptor [Psychroserpens sp.]MBO6630041.1 TonB-dependent receptor [Psychroserpens sp.]MBO6653609.1 TonB-dependent receptor [Psychroserpens sp.]MBO6681930.1 TonB-dependent receptor [Psychroserpens sp.]MBO6748956.1 TonB-dependent receptor [Psychroserpens sp.]